MRTGIADFAAYYAIFRLSYSMIGFVHFDAARFAEMKDLDPAPIILRPLRAQPGPQE